LSALNCGSDASLPRPNCGAPPEPTALPSRPKILAELDAIGAIVPPAASTSGSARTCASSDSGADLAAREALQRYGDHRSVTASSASRISCAVERPTSRTIRPSARKRMRSAIRRGVRVVRDHHRRLA